MRKGIAAAVHVFAFAFTVSLAPGCGANDHTGARLSESVAGGARSARLTPGDFCTQQDPDFDEYRYEERMPHCRRNVSQAEKVAVAATYDVDADELKDYQVDHFIPLALGGSNDRKNLWPLIYAEARRKAKFEQQLYFALSRGEMTQAEAVAAIRAWE